MLKGTQSAWSQTRCYLFNRYVCQDSIKSQEVYIGDVVKHQKTSRLVWSSTEAAEYLIDRKVVIVVQGQAFLFTSTDGQT